MPLLSPRNGGRRSRGKIPEVKSGIALSAFRPVGSQAATIGTTQPGQTFLTSRFARVLLAGAGFLADAYDLFVINLVLRLLRDEYPEYAGTDHIHFYEGGVAAAALVGSIIGQLVAGSLADVIGRKKIFVVTALLISLGSFGSSTSVDASYLSIYGNLSIWRFFLGVGVGGEYPLAATVTSESSSAARRGAQMAAVFSMQGVGALLSAFVVIACLSSGLSAGFTWRFALAFGALPVVVAFPWRLQMHETETFERVKKERQQARQVELEHGVISRSVNVSNSSFSRQPLEQQPLLSPPGFPPGQGQQQMLSAEVSAPASCNSSFTNAQTRAADDGLGGTGYSVGYGSTGGSDKPLFQQQPPQIVDSTEFSMHRQHQQVMGSEGNGFPAGFSSLHCLDSKVETSEHSRDWSAPINSANNNAKVATATGIASTDSEREYDDYHGDDGDGDSCRGTLGAEVAPNARRSQESNNSLYGSGSGIVSNNEHSTFGQHVATSSSIARGGGGDTGGSGGGGGGGIARTSHPPLAGTINKPFPGSITSQPLRPAIPSAMKKVSSFGSNAELQPLLAEAAAGKRSSRNEARIGGTVAAGGGCCSLLKSNHFQEIGKAFKYYKYHLVGTSLCWFLLDVDFYANGLFNHDITASVLNAPGQRTTALQDAINTMILGFIAVPGYWLSVLFIDRVGRKFIQIMGFCMMGLLFLICGVCYDWLMDSTDPQSYNKYIFLLLYALTFLFSNFGPNTTSFVIPGEVFPTEVRATCHGISAAFGKLGAASGAYVFPLLLGPGGATNPTHAGIQNCMFICGGVAVLGAILTVIFIPSYTPELLAAEGRYLPLDFECLRPAMRDLLLIESHSEASLPGLMAGLEAGNGPLHGASTGSLTAADRSLNQQGNRSGNGMRKSLRPNPIATVGTDGEESFEMQQIILSADNYSMDVRTPLAGSKAGSKAGTPTPTPSVNDDGSSKRSQSSRSRSSRSNSDQASQR